jgi:putative Ca2+/H+ antiporter (TMEM165/GDT1 family)
MESLFVPTGVVALAEIGDKTQLLALMLAARFRRPWPIVLGILVATLANHAAAAWAGTLAADLLAGEVFRRGLGISFIAMGLWALIPDKLEEGEVRPASGHGAFWVTTVTFFLVEIGDKTQIATVALAAEFQSVFWVTAGTTLGMMLANVPVVFLGDRAATALPLGSIRVAAALVFMALGAYVLAV